MSKIRKVETNIYKLNHRIPNGTYGGVKGYHINEYYIYWKFTLFDCFIFIFMLLRFSGSRLFKNLGIQKNNIL